jgi:hypothetical protein
MPGREKIKKLEKFPLKPVIVTKLRPEIFKTFTLITAITDDFRKWEL